MKTKIIITLVNLIVVFAYYQSNGQNLTLNATDKAKFQIIASKWGNSIICLESLYQHNKSSTLKDTLIGTGFVINDSNKFYLVTVKHIIKSDLNGSDINTANNLIFIKINQYTEEEKYLDLNNLSKKNLPGKSYTLNSDEDDLAIISLQTNKDILSYLLDHQITPIPIEYIDTISDQVSGDAVVQLSYSRVKGYGGKKVKAVNVGKIDNSDKRKPFFLISNLIVHQGNNGAPIFSLTKSKVIGMVCNEIKTLSNNDILKDPFFTGTSAKVINTSTILSCLKKFQTVENK